MKRYGDGLMVETIKDVRSLTRRRKGVFYAYKYSDHKGRSATRSSARPRLQHKVKAVLSVPNANTDRSKDCAAGVNVATRAWIMGLDSPVNVQRFYDSWYQEFYGGLRLWVVRFTRRNLACVPTDSTGKFRLFKCKIVAEETVTRGPT